MASSRESRSAARRELRWRLWVLAAVALLLIAGSVYCLDVTDAAWAALLLLGSVTAQCYLQDNRR